MATQRKAKRALSNIDFSKEGAHVALVSKDLGGPANLQDYALILKANNFSQEYIEKIQQVKVTMELPDFLQKFFYIYGEDAKVLAYMMGYVEPEETSADQKMEAEDEFQNWVKDRVESFEVIKNLNDSEDVLIALSKLNQEEYLSVVKAQASLEQYLQKQDSVNKTEEGSTEAVAKAKESDDVNQAKVEPSGETQKLGKSMTKEVEMVEKSTLVDIQKSLDSTKVELQKALDQLAAVEAEKKEAIRKSKLAVIKDAVKEDKHVEALAKAALSLEAEEFDSFVAVIKELAAKVDNSNLFAEQGVTSTEETQVKESAVAKALKSQNIVK